MTLKEEEEIKEKALEFCTLKKKKKVKLKLTQLFAVDQASNQRVTADLCD